MVSKYPIIKTIYPMILIFTNSFRYDFQKVGKTGISASPPIHFLTTANIAAVAGKKPKKINPTRSEEHTSELQSRGHLVCRLLLEKKKKEISKPHNSHS